MPTIEHLHVGAAAVATDGDIGSVKALLVDPTVGAVTHVVVTNADIPQSGRVVALSHVTVTGAGQIRLDLSRGQVLASAHFVIPGRLPETDAPGTLATYWFGAPGSPTFAVHEQLPSLGEIALRAHVPVRSREGGHIGLVDELLVDPDNGAITALSLHEGHIFGRRSVVIPMSAVISIGDDSLTTSLDRSVFDVLAASAPNE